MQILRECIFKAHNGRSRLNGYENLIDDPSTAPFGLRLRGIIEYSSHNGRSHDAASNDSEVEIPKWHPGSLSQNLNPTFEELANPKPT